MSFSIDIPALPHDLDKALQHKIDTKTKPVGSLGRLESIAFQVGRIQKTLTPRLSEPRVLVFAGDHGIARDGVSAYPQDVTWQMVMNFLAGGAAVNVLAREQGMRVDVVDAGVNHDFAAAPGLITRKIAYGTGNSAVEPAMTRAQAEQALETGLQLARDAHVKGCNVMAFGEMGIANTSAAALLLHKLAGVPLDVAVGRGTGMDDAGMERKRAVLGRAAARTGTLSDPIEVLAEYGGFEIAMMAGAMLGAAESGCLLLIDGFITSSAMLVASHIAPHIKDYAVFSHQSAERGHQAMLQAMHAQPLLSLDLRLGEGTGAALAYALVRSAVAFLNDMASFESAGVSDKDA
jgi:nicotinate-nucleotide--dimethylbenzimidazole phosphoribosyltransferase